MKPYPFFLLLLLLFSCKQSARKVEDRYANGQAITERYYPNRKDTSTYTYRGYYENGRLEYEAQVISNLFVGEKKTFFENGRLQRIEKLSRPTPLGITKYDGYIINFHPDGTRKSEYQYVNDKITGLAVDYDSIGIKARTAEYTGGKMNGKETLYFPSGGIKSIAFVKNDTLRGFRVEFKENGDTLMWIHNGEYGFNGVFYKKWLDNGLTLTGNYGDTLMNYVIWKWYDKTNKEVKSKVVTSKNGDYIIPK